jgi:hypothetical protein
MRIGISFILILILPVIQGVCQEKQEFNEKENDKIKLEDRLGIITPKEELGKNDTFSLKILPYPESMDSSFNQDNMPVFRLYSSDHMPNAVIAQPGVKYFILNSMGPDHYIKPIDSGENKIQPHSDKNKE